MIMLQGRPALPAVYAQVEEGLRGHRALRRRLHRRGAHQPAPRSQARIAGGKINRTYLINYIFLSSNFVVKVCNIG